jgi:hypothetical protein
MNENNAKKYLKKQAQCKEVKKVKAMQRGEKSMRKKHERQPSCIEGGIWEKGCK